MAPLEAPAPGAAAIARRAGVPMPSGRTRSVTNSARSIPVGTAQPNNKKAKNSKSASHATTTTQKPTK